MGYLEEFHIDRSRMPFVLGLFKDGAAKLGVPHWGNNPLLDNSLNIMQKFRAAFDDLTPNSKSKLGDLQVKQGNPNPGFHIWFPDICQRYEMGSSCCDWSVLRKIWHELRNELMRKGTLDTLPMFCINW